MNFLKILFVLSVFSNSGVSQIIPDHEERLMHSYDSTIMIDLRNVESPQARPFQNSKVAFSAAVAGGGYRATFFALGIMLELENIRLAHKTITHPTDVSISNRHPHLVDSSNLLNEVDYFSTVSGGGFAVGFYLASMRLITSLENQRRLFCKEKNLDFKFPDPIDTCNKPVNKSLDQFFHVNTYEWLLLRSGPLLRQSYKYSYICYDYESRYLGKKMGKTSSFAPKLYKGNSGTLVRHLLTKPSICSEKKFRKFFLLGEDIDDKVLFPKKGSEVQLPFLISNATIVGNVLPFRFTPNIFQNFRVIRDTFNLAFALMTSASFPGFFANQSLKCRIGVSDKEPSYIHLMDGGVFDNSGVRTAIELLNLDKSPYKYLLLIDARGVDIPSSYTLRGQDFNLTSVVDLVTDLQYLLVDSLANQSHYKNVVLNLKSILSSRDKNAAFHNPYRYTYKFMSDTLIKLFGYKDGFYPDKKIDEILYAYSHIEHRDHDAARSHLQNIYEICSNIKTNLYLDEWEKRILILAGKIAVRKNINVIRTRFCELW